MPISLYRILFLLCLISLQPIALWAQELPRVAMPYIAHYTKADYAGGNQNWGLAVDSTGIIYAANHAGLMRYDGKEWHLNRLAKAAPLRSVQIAKDGKIFTGGKGDFGFWEDQGFGRLKYTSLAELVADSENLKRDEIWKIIFHKSQVIFQSFSKAYVYEKNKITTLKADGEPFLFSFQVRDRIYFEQLPSGLHRLSNGKLNPVLGKSILADKRILSMLPFSGGQTLIATERDGLFLMDRSEIIRPWKTEAQQLFEQHQINNGLQVGKDLYAFGTIKNGLIIINSRGELIQHLDKNSGLQNNTILSLTLDRQSNLWIGMDNGIDRLDLHSPLYYYTDQTGTLGTVYASAIFNGELYLGTNQGLFKSLWRGPFSNTPLKFQFVGNSNGQVWFLKEIDGKLYCGHNAGLFVLNNGELQATSPFTGSQQLLSVPNKPYVLEGNYTGLSLFERNNGSIKHRFQYPNLKQSIKYIADEHGKGYWIGNENQIQFFTFNQDFSALKGIGAAPKGLPKDAKIFGIYPMGGRNVFATDSGLYRFDNVLNEFTSYNELNDILGPFATSNRIQKDADNSYWLFKDAKVAKLSLHTQANATLDSTTWQPISEKIMSGYENVQRIQDGIDLFGLNDGFALYIQKLKSDNSYFTNPLITGFWNITSDPKNIDLDQPIAYSRNNIRITYSLPWYEANPLQFQYRLVGFSNVWSEWSSDNYRDFTNLPHGDYRFEIRAKNVNGVISETTSLPFTVSRPWYWSWFAIVLYIVLAICAVYLGRKWYQKRLFKAKEQLRRKLELEKEDALKRENDVRAKQVMQLKNDQLELELDNKKRELANMATNLVYKNDLLKTLHEALSNIKGSDGKPLSSDQLKKVNKLIEEAKNDEREWELFESSFNESHDNFFRKLKQDYPELVPNDLKLCAYLRLNMSSKEIASLLNISLRGVEIRRYRLRKKLQLETHKNLTEFLLEI
ncbi:triple tyrosine motif-containing protein [Sphingobacterium corticis]|uniref:Triple tyrosine motif-containing protein n=1 Tax=Sphingobacterium corticis TaxID=1812823 RepID=A0ABW5NK59_9SPHI